MDWSDIPLMAYGLKLAKAVLGLVMLTLFATYADQREGHSFAESMEKIATDARALAQFYGLRWVAFALAAGMLVGCTSAAGAATVFPTKYDRAIASAVDTWWPDYPHRAAWRAQLYQESRLDPRAVSPVGARGLAQFMPGTWADMTREMKLGAVSPESEVAVEVGAYYMAKLRKGWRSPRPTEDRQRLAQASYNAGIGNLIKAQARCGGPALYAEIIPCLPEVTGERNAHETRTYVERIAKWRNMMEAGL